jgi:hypothetical protein
MADLPPFPVDDATLDLLGAALDPWGNGQEDAERSSLGEFLDMMSTLGGSDTEAIADRCVFDAWGADFGEAAGARCLNDSPGHVHGLVEMRDPQYSSHDVMLALIGEIRRLRRG